jgi:hypothetical protein
MQEIINRADAGKLEKARARLTAAATGQGKKDRCSEKGTQRYASRRFFTPIISMVFSSLRSKNTR